MRVVSPTAEQAEEIVAAAERAAVRFPEAASRLREIGRRMASHIGDGLPASFMADLNDMFARMAGVDSLPDEPDDA